MKWILIVLALTGCARGSEDSCGFVMVNGYRATWGSQVPVVLEIDSSLPEDFKPAINAAVLSWNRAAGREILRIGASYNKIYYITDWGIDPMYAGLTKRTVFMSQIVQATINLNGNLKHQDMESLILHELGHVLGLGHTDGGVMDPYLGDYVLRRTLDTKTIYNLRCEY